MNETADDWSLLLPFIPASRNLFSREYDKSMLCEIGSYAPTKQGLLWKIVVRVSGKAWEGKVLKTYVSVS